MIILLLGYRHVHLHTPTWEKIEHATIFVHVTIHEAHHFSIKVCMCVCVCVCVCVCCLCKCVVCLQWRI